MKIIVIGANGFIGKSIVTCFSKKKHKTVFPIFNSAENIQEIKEVLNNNSIDLVINAAGLADVAGSVINPQKDFDINVYLHLKILSLIKDIQCKYIYFSSAAVYGNAKRLPVSETDDLQPISPYGWHKYYAEQICKEFSSLYKVRTASLRLFSVYGPGQKKMLIYDLFKKSTAKEGCIELQGLETDSRDFVYIEDVLQAMKCVIDKGEMNGECYNVASGNEISIKQLAEKFLEIIASKKKIIFNGNVIPGYPSKWKADISRIAGLGFKPSISIKQGLKETTQWLKDNA